MRLKLTIISLLSFVTFAAHASDSESPSAVKAVNIEYIRNLCKALNPATAEDCFKSHDHLSDPNHNLRTSIASQICGAQPKTSLECYAKALAEIKRVKHSVSDLALAKLANGTNKCAELYKGDKNEAVHAQCVADTFKWATGGMAKKPDLFDPTIAKGKACVGRVLERYKVKVQQKYNEERASAQGPTPLARSEQLDNHLDMDMNEIQPAMQKDIQGKCKDDRIDYSAARDSLNKFLAGLNDGIFGDPENIAIDRKIRAGDKAQQ